MYGASISHVGSRCLIRVPIGHTLDHEYGSYAYRRIYGFIERFKKDEVLFVDCSSVEHVDSAGLARLVDMYHVHKRKRPKQPVNLVLDEAGVMRRALDGSGLTPFFKIWNDSKEA